MTPELGTAIGSLLLAIAAFIKSKIDVDSVKKDREVTREQRDSERKAFETRVAVLEKVVELQQARLAEGDNNFKDLSNELNRTNGLLNQIVGELKYIRGTRK